MKYLYKIDAWILSKFQKFSDFFVKTFGWRGFQYKAAIACLLGLYGLVCLEMLLKGNLNVLGLLFLTYLIGSLYRETLKEEKRSLKNDDVVYLSSLSFKLMARVLRVIYVIMILGYLIFRFISLPKNILLEFYLPLGQGIVIVFFAYFVACKSPPYQKSKLREWVEGLLLKLVPVKNK